MKKSDKYFAKKRFGQNFLHDQNIINKIVGIINPKPKQSLLEIGPGLGALTQPVLAISKRLTAIELDRDIIITLKKTCAKLGDLQLISADVLKVNLAEILPAHTKTVIFGNLPYNISTPILFHCLQAQDLCEYMVFMLQKEVVERICAEPNSKQYGRLSVMLQYQCEVANALTVSRHCFSPVPKVESAIVTIAPKTEIPLKANNYTNFHKVVLSAFNQRRKTITNALKTLLSAELISSVGVDCKARPENLTVTDYVKLSNLIKFPPSVLGGDVTHSVREGD